MTYCNFLCLHACAVPICLLSGESEERRTGPMKKGERKKDRPTRAPGRDDTWKFEMTRDKRVRKGQKACTRQRHCQTSAMTHVTRTRALAAPCPWAAASAPAHRSRRSGDTAHGAPPPARRANRMPTRVRYPVRVTTCPRTHGHSRPTVNHPRAPALPRLSLLNTCAMLI